MQLFLVKFFFTTNKITKLSIPFQTNFHFTLWNDSYKSEFLDTYLFPKIYSGWVLF